MSEAEEARDVLATLTASGALDALETVVQLEGSTIVFEIAFCFGDRQQVDQKPLLLALGAGPFRLDRIVLARGLTVVEMDGAKDPLTGRAGLLLLQLDGASWAGARFVGRISGMERWWRLSSGRSRSRRRPMRVFSNRSEPLDVKRSSLASLENVRA
jgi:hypothetical protein